jgi:DNA-binding NtrC family response regulator
VDPGRLVALLERGLGRPRRPAAREGAAGTGAPGAEPFQGRSRAIARVMDQVRHFATTHSTVLIEGETGTGKELAALAIHAHSPRRDRAFVAVDCAAGPAQTLERALFGTAAEPGRIEQAEGGTLFLDDVGAASPAVQVRLLRLVQERAFERVGGRDTRRADVRVISASRRDLDAQVRAGAFRDDLHQRLSVVRIVMPPLRERREDIPVLVAGFLRDLNRTHRPRVRGVTRGVLERLERHAWPGNVRELRDTIERMAAAAPGGRPLDLADLPAALRGESEGERIEIAPGMTVEEAERLLIAATLAHAGGDKPRAAAMLGIGLRTLYRKIRTYGIG